MSKWQSMLDEIQKEINKEDSQAEEARTLKTIEEDAEVPAEFADAIPDLFSDDQKAQVKAERQAEEDEYLKKLNILSIYKKLTGNSVKLSGGENEKLVFCPTADHHNSNSEAACINTSKNTWVCYGQCEDGGGIIDMVAAANGMPFGKKLKGTDYAKAKQKTLEDFCGWVFDKQGKGWVGKSPETQKLEQEEFDAEVGYPQPVDNPVDNQVQETRSAEEIAKELGFSLSALSDDDDLPELGATSFNKGEFGADSPQSKTKASPHQDSRPASPVTKPASEAKPASRPVLSVVEDSEDTEDQTEDFVSPDEKLPEITDIWENIPEGTPLYEYMKVTEEMDVPPEYCLFRGLQLLSLSAGPYVRGKVGRIFKTTLSVLFVGVSGTGKSQSRWAMDEILDHIVYKWHPSPPSGTKFGTHTGIKRLIEPGSGEYLIEQFSEESADGVKYQVVDVMGELEVDELSRFMGKGAVTGSSLVGVFQEMDNNPALDGAIKAGSRSGGVVHATNPNLVFSAGVQPAALPRLIGKGNIGNGLLARFEVVTGNRIPGEDPFDNKLKDTDYCQELYTDVAVYYMNKVDPGEKNTRKLFIIEVEAEARDEMRKAYQQVEGWKTGDDLKSRFDLKLFKLATLFCINRKADKVIREDVRSALWVMEYLNRSTTITGEKTVTTEGNEMEDSIVRAIIATTDSGTPASDGKIWSRATGKRKGWDREAFSKKLISMEERGILISRMHQGKRGPKTKVYGVRGQAMLELAQEQPTTRGHAK